MASAEYPIELLDDELKLILFNFGQVAMSYCRRDISYVHLARLWKLGDLYKDLELEGMQTITQNTNFKHCVQMAITKCKEAIFGIYELPLAYIALFALDYPMSSDFQALQQICSECKMSDYYALILKGINDAKECIAEVYARYITTRGAFKDQVIEALNTVRQEMIHYDTGVRYLLTITDAMIDQVCADESLNIPMQLLVKFCVYSNFTIELAEIQLQLPTSPIDLLHYLLLSPDNPEEMCARLESECTEVAEFTKKLIERKQKNLPAKIYEGIRVIKESYANNKSISFGMLRIV